MLSCCSVYHRPLDDVHQLSGYHVELRREIILLQQPVKTMIIGVCEIELHIPEATSLKAKRSVLKSLLARLHNTFNVSAAEVDKHNLWQSAVIGVAVVSNSSVHSRQVLNNILEWIETYFPQIYITQPGLNCARHLDNFNDAETIRPRYTQCRIAQDIYLTAEVYP